MKKIEQFIEKERVFQWLLVGIFFLLIFSKNSMLYKTNDWVDSNAFLTVGKGMFSGLVPYKDLFEQKGPYLYFIYGISSLLSSNVFLGVFFLECIGMAVNLVCCFKILKLYLPEKISFLLTILFPTLILNYYFFRQGGSAEEFCIPLLMILVYQVLRNVKNLNDNNFIEFSKLTYFWQGFVVSLVFLTKFSLLGPWIAFYLFLGIYIVVKKEYKHLLGLILYSGLGFLLGVIPWILYFILTNSFYEFINVYIVINSTAYNTTSFNSFNKILFILTQLIKNIKMNLLNIVFLVPIVPCILIDKSFSKKLIGRLFILSIISSTVIFMYVGMQTYEYYFLFFMCYGVFGLILLGKYIAFIYKNVSLNIDVNTPLLTFISVFFAFFISLGNNGNIEESLLYPGNRTVGIDAKEPKQTAQELFAEYMHTEMNNPTLLNYGFLDGGFYQAANILPTERYFELQNIDHSIYPNNYKMQQDAINQKRVDFFVIETSEDYQESEFDNAGFLTNYRIAMSHKQSRDQRNYKYWLFEMK